MPAIVLDHEQANEQPGGERRQREGKPELAMVRGKHHRGPHGGEGREGDREFKDAARASVLARQLRAESLHPVASRPRRAFGVRRRHFTTSARYALSKKSVVERESFCAEGGSPGRSMRGDPPEGVGARLQCPGPRLGTSERRHDQPARMKKR